MIEMLGRTQIPPDRTQAVTPAGSREPSTGAEGGTGFDQALDTALDIGSEAAAAAAAMAQGLPQAPAPVETSKAPIDPDQQAAVPDKGGTPAFPAVEMELPVRPTEAKAFQVKPGEAKAVESGKLASIQGQDSPVAREGSSVPIEDRVSSRLESMMGGAKPWDSSWIREGMPKPQEAAAKAGVVSGSAPVPGLQASAAVKDLLSARSGRKEPPDGGAAAINGATLASIQKMLQPGGAQDAALEGAEIDSVRVFPQDRGVEANGKQTDDAPAAKAGAKVLGGSDFLSMLQDVRSGGTGANVAGESAAQSVTQSTTQSALAGAAAAVEAQPSGRPVAQEPSIRELGGKPIKRGEREVARTTPAGAAGISTAPAPSGGAPVEVSGQVVPGPMSRERLATASVANLSAGINGLKGQGGGEMKLRLKPENLGELQLQVTTHGNQVSVKVHASSDQAREILEESLSSLKDSLAGHKLMLGKIEIVSGGQQSADTGSGTGQQQSQQFASDFGGSRNPESSRDFGGDGGGRSGGRESREELTPGITTAIPASRRMAASGGAARTSGRLDVMA